MANSFSDKIATMKIRHVIFFFIFLLFCDVYPQSYYPYKALEVDSLLKELTDKTNKNRVDALNSLGLLNVRHFPVKAKTNSEEALALAKQLSYKRGEAVSNYVLGTSHYYQGDYTQAISYLLKSYQIFQSFEICEEQAVCAFTLAVSLHLADIDKLKAIEFMKEAIHLFGELGLERERGLSFLDLSVAMRWGKKYEEALQLNKNAYSILVTKGYGISIDKGICTAVTGDIFRDMGQIHQSINHYLSAVGFYNTTRIEDIALKSQCYATLGMDYKNIGKPDSALWYITEGIRLGKSVGNIYNQFGNFYHLANLYLTQNNTPLAIASFDSTLYYLNLADSLGYFYLNEKYRYYISYSFELYQPMPISYRRNYIRETKIKVYKTLSSIYMANGDYKKAVQLFELKDAMEDSVYAFTRNTELKEIVAKYQNEQKDQQIELLFNETKLHELQVAQIRYTMIALIGIVILIVIIALLFFRQNRFKLQQQNIRLQQKFLRSQMNPHFIFNSLASIQNFIITEEPLKASKYLVKFSKLVRNILDSSSEETIPLEDEIVTIENYLALQKIRFPEKFVYSIDVDEKIDTTEIQIPPMLGQPFIENAIEHGIKHKETIGHIQVSFRLEKMTLIYEIEDDGIGRKKSQEILQKQNKDHKSLATSITTERIQVLNKKLKSKITFSIEDLKNDKGETAGTKVGFEIPV